MKVVVASAPGPDWPRRLFEPLGYEVAIETTPHRACLGSQPLLHLRYTGSRLQDVLTHLYVLLPGARQR